MYSGGLCEECKETFYSNLTACEECADDARRCVDTTETLLCEDGATLDNPACTTVTDPNVLLFENHHPFMCSDFTNTQGDRRVVKELRSIQMDAKGDECASATTQCWSTTRAMGTTR